MKAMRPVIASNGVPYLQISLVGMNSTIGRKKERPGFKSISKLINSIERFFNEPNGDFI